MTTLLKFGDGINALIMRTEDGFTADKDQDLEGSGRISVKNTLGGFSAKPLALNANTILLQGEFWPEKLRIERNPPVFKHGGKTWIDIVEEWMRARRTRGTLRWGPFNWGPYYLKKVKFKFRYILRGTDGKSLGGGAQSGGGMAPRQMDWLLEFIQAEPDRIVNGRQLYPIRVAERDLRQLAIERFERERFIF